MPTADVIELDKHPDDHEEISSEQQETKTLKHIRALAL